MEDYFCIKRPDYTQLQSMNPEVIHTPGLYQQQIRSAIRLCQRQTERMAIHKNALVPFNQVVAGKVVSKSGSSVLSKDLNLPIKEFEWSSKSLDNTLWAIQRHLSAKMRPDESCLNEFGMMTEGFMSDLVQRILSENPWPQGYLMDYPKG